MDLTSRSRSLALELHRLSDALAIKATLAFGSMPMAYAFMIYGALGAFFVEQQPTLLYWSNWIQLWALPLLMVGTNLLSRDSERRARETHDAVMEELKFLRELHSDQDNQFKLR